MHDIQAQIQATQAQVQAQAQATLERVDVMMQERFTGMATILAAQIEALRTREG